MINLNIRPIRCLRKLLSSSGTVGCLVVYIQLATVVLIVSSASLIELGAHFEDHRLNHELNDVLLQEDELLSLAAGFSRIAILKEKFFLDESGSQHSSRVLAAGLSKQLSSLSLQLYEGSKRRNDQGLPAVVVKDFDAAHQAILRAERAVARFLAVDRQLKRAEGLALLRSYPLADLASAQDSLSSSTQELHLLALQIEERLDDNQELHAILLFLSLLISSLVAMIASYLLYRRSIVRPLESIASVASTVSLLDRDGGDVTHNLPVLEKACADFQVSSHGLQEIKSLRLVMSTLFARLHGSYEKLSDLAMTDALCQIGNRRSLDVYGTQVWQQAARDSSTIAVLMIDVDYFKRFNDLYGHGKGDEILSAVSQCLSQDLRRPMDAVFRYGGEEFLMLVYGSTFECFERIAHSVIDNIWSLAIDHSGAPAGRVTISVGGFFVANARMMSMQDAINSADKLLYCSKNMGRNRVSIDQSELRSGKTSDELVDG